MIETEDGLGVTDRWCILRMRASSTITVTESLTRAGFEVWTPIANIVKRHTPARLRKKVTAPAWPTYAFARAVHLDDLLAEIANPKSNHPDFSIYREYERYPLVTDRELAEARAAERRNKPRKEAPVFAQGDQVRVTDGVAAGMSGIVERAKGKYALVCFPNGSVPLEISTFALVPNVVGQLRAA